MDGVTPHLGSEVNRPCWASLLWPVVVAAVDWAGLGHRCREGLTRVQPAWPPAWPWTHLGGWPRLGGAALLQTGESGRKAGAGRGFTAVRVPAVVVLTEYSTGRTRA